MTVLELLYSFHFKSEWIMATMIGTLSAALSKDNWQQAV
jgi:hypothetical protein